MPEGNIAHCGSQADIILKDGKLLKVYKPDCGFNANVLRLVKRMKGQGQVVDLYDFGTMEYEGEQRQFELMEFCPEGAVSSFDLKGNKEAIKEIIKKTAAALDACHSMGFIHKDVKPANILVRDKKTWNCVLCDFGIADVLDHGKVTTLQSRTPIYAAPEVYEHTATIGNLTYCELTPAADFYSLGITILSLWYGESAFHGKESVLAVQKVHDGIVVPADIPEPLNTLARGLLVKDPAHRWGFKEINDFLSGNMVVVHNEAIAGGLNILFNSRKNQIANTPEELADFMAEDPELAIKYLYSGKISKWLDKIPELQVEIEHIIEEEFINDQKMGLLAAIHSLNPFCDPVLCHDLQSPDYAMTGETLGRMLNNVYYHYYTKNDADDVATLIAKSFERGHDDDYFPWFLDHKGNRFTKQRQWFDYCVRQNKDNTKKAGPKDKSYVNQVAMMKTIAGFGATPEYRLSRSGAVLNSINDVYHVSKSDLRYDLQNDKGLRGWLAVMCHENPHVDLKRKFSYEKLLEKYVELIGYIDSNNTVYRRFLVAQSEADSFSSGAKNKIRSTWAINIIHKLMIVFLAVIPLCILCTEIILNIIDNPSVKVSGWTEYLFYGFGIIAAVIAFFVMDSDGCIIPIIVGALVSLLITFVIGLLGSIIMYIYALIVLGVLVFFGFATLFETSKHRRHIHSVTNPSFEELVLEPLYYAFSNEKQFDSSLNGDANGKEISLWKEEVRKRWGMILLFIGSAIVLSLFRFLLPKSERMERFDRAIHHPIPIEKTVEVNQVEVEEHETM